jgi:Glycosyltransferase family 87
MRARSRLQYPVSVVRSVFDQTGPANGQLAKGLALLLVLVIVISLPSFLAWMPGTDLEIPLLAASRWADGGTPYVASSFAETSGTGLPFLYPPFVLPVLSAIAGLPRPIVLGAWLVLLLAVAMWTCRRLSVPWPAVPLVLLWPPFMEGLVAGNVQVLQLAAFVALFFVPGRAWELRSRSWTRSGDSDRERRLGNDTRYGLYAAGIGAVKSTQLLALVWLLRLRPRAAIIGGTALAVVALAMLPLTGLQLYRDWMDQLGRAADLSWAPAGGPLDFVIGRPLALVAAGIAVGAMFFVRGRDAGAWVGIAMLVAAPSIHGYGMLLLLPTLLVLRRDIAITLAILIARYNIYAWWISIAVAAVCLAASKVYPGLRAQVQFAQEPDLQAEVPAGATTGLRRR